jgi:hypothetical protein
MLEDMSDSRALLMTRLAIVAGILFALGGLMALMGTISGLLNLVPYRIWFVSTIAMALYAGMLTLPIMVYLGAPSFPRGMRDVLGSIMWTIQMLCFGAGVLVERARGGYQMFAADVDDDKRAVITLDDAEVTIEPDDDAGWSRLGMAPFTVTWERSDEALAKFVEKEEPIVQDTLQRQVPTGDAMTDGGEPAVQEFDVLERTRGGFREFRERFDAEWTVRVDRIQDYLGKRAGGPNLSNNAEEYALRKYGGSGGLSTKWKVVGVVLCLALGVMTGIAGMMI